MSSRKIGRPRDENIRIKILDSAITILIKCGYNKATMKNIAINADVSKQTLYRWWNNKAELLMESFVYYAEKNVLFPEGCPGNEGLFEFLSNTFDNSSNTEEIRVLLKSLLAESINDPDFAKTFFNKFIIKRQKFLIEKLMQIPELKNQNETKIDTIVDLIFGAMWYRILFSHRPLDKNFAKEIVNIIFD